ncbi:MAG: response regulator transcription factor [Candidatus Marinimicrobia bacterium]|nr:response regulator transcription factor [Candidatus Neomarinimicrobiota bacterium]
MTIAIFDRRTVLRDALKLVFSSFKNINVVSENDNIYSTLTCVQKEHPDVILIDPALFGNQLIHFIHVIMKFNPSTKFVLLPASDDEQYYPADDNNSNVVVLNAKDGMDKVVRIVNRC